MKVSGASYTHDPYNAFSQVKRVLNNVSAQNVSYCLDGKCAITQQTYSKFSGSVFCPQRAFGVIHALL